MEIAEELERYLLERNEEKLGDMSLTLFDTPPDVAGTAFLSHTKIFDPDDQWLFLPALKRVKRISSRNKSGPFMGSEFAYEDLVSREVEKYSYKFLKDEECPTIEENCFVLESIPLYKNSGYSKQISWIDHKEYRTSQVEYYDRRNALLKTLKFTNHKKYKDKHWRAANLDMFNHQTKKSTALTFEDYNFDVNLKRSDFKASRLKRMR